MPEGPGGAEPLRFRFGPRDRRGLVAGVRTGQLVLLAVSLGLTAVLARTPGRLSLPGAVVSLLVGVALGWLPVAGRTPEEWLPICLRHGSGRLIRLLSPARSPRLSPAARPVPGLFAGLQVIEASRRIPATGAVYDRRAGTLSAALSVGPGAFALLDEAEREHRVAAWAAVLASGAQESGVHRLQWVERTVPLERSPGAAPFSTESEGASPAGQTVTGPRPGGDRKAAARRSYEALLRAERGGLRHELLLVCTVRTVRSFRHRAGDSSTPHGPPTASLELLTGELASLERRCRDAGLAIEGPLSAAALEAALWRSTEFRPRAREAGAAPSRSPCAVGWSSLRTGALWHTTYWVAEWPRHDVPSDFLLPLLLEHRDRRSLSLVMAPLPPGRAVRAAEHARTSGAADAELRRRHGFALTARSRREQEAVVRRESELAEGHAGYRFSGYLTVSAPSPEELARARRRLEQASALARLELRRLDGVQDHAFTCTLPLGRGCR